MADTTIKKSDTRFSIPVSDNSGKPQVTIEPGKKYEQSDESYYKDYMNKRKMILDSVEKSLADTPEEIAKKEKAYKRKVLLTALSDAISGFSNLYAASQGAPARKITPAVSGIVKDYQEYKEGQDALKKKMKYQTALEKLKELDADYANRVKTKMANAEFNRKVYLQDRDNQYKLTRDAINNQSKDARTNASIKAKIDIANAGNANSRYIAAMREQGANNRKLYDIQDKYENILFDVPIKGEDGKESTAVRYVSSKVLDNKQILYKLYTDILNENPDLKLYDEDNKSVYSPGSEPKYDDNRIRAFVYKNLKRAPITYSIFISAYGVDPNQKDKKGDKDSKSDSGDVDGTTGATIPWGLGYIPRDAKDISRFYFVTDEDYSTALDVLKIKDIRKTDPDRYNIAKKIETKYLIQQELKKADDYFKSEINKTSAPVGTDTDYGKAYNAYRYILQSDGYGIGDQHTYDENMRLLLDYIDNKKMNNVVIRDAGRTPIFNSAGIPKELDKFLDGVSTYLKTDLHKRGKHYKDIAGYKLARPENNDNKTDGSGETAYNTNSNNLLDEERIIDDFYA